MKKLICLTGILLSILNAMAQKSTAAIEPLCVQGYFPDISLGKIFNYKDTTTVRSGFGDKVIIFDFWSTHCGSCVDALPKNDSIQKVLGDQLQVIMVTKEPQKTISAFVKKWELSHNRKLSIPIVVEDTVISKYFWHSYMPNYSWLLPDGKFMLQTSKIYINKEMLAGILYGHTTSSTN